MLSKIFKIGIGATLSVLIAEFFGLSYSMSAGIITILSIEETKKKSWDIALLRLKSTALALAIGSIVFLTFGFKEVYFGVYLLLFLPLAFKFKLKDGIVVSSVLVTHLITEKAVNAQILFNSMCLMGIGVGVGLLFNLHMPNMLPQIKKDQKLIEEKFREILRYFSMKVRHQIRDEKEQELLSSLKELLAEAQQRAKDNRENYFLEEMTYYSKYMQMRFHQYEVLTRLNTLLDQVDVASEQTELVADLTEKFADSLHEFNPGHELISETEKVLEICRNQELPKTRAEFENRAMLFQYLNEFRHLLEIKRDFVKHLTEEEKALFLNKEEE